MHSYRTLGSTGQAWLKRLLQVRLASDIHERATDLGLPLPPGPNRRRRLAKIAERRLLFIHIPKNGGTSISEALYGTHIGHNTIRYYRAVAPIITETVPTFAVLRDPADRFLSAYRHASRGEAADAMISSAFRNEYRAFRSIDDAIDHVEGVKSLYTLDNIFRPQMWYVKDIKGAVAVPNLFHFLDRSRLDAWIAPWVASLPHLNRSRPAPISLRADQRRRLRSIYAEDYELIASLAAGAVRNR